MELYPRLIASIENRIGVALITVTTIRHQHSLCPMKEAREGTKLLLYSDGHVECEHELSMDIWQPVLDHAKSALDRQQSKTFLTRLECCEIEFFVDVYPPPLHLIIAGAGHVARPLVEMGSKLGLYITVVCDRPQYANAEQFPCANEIVCKPYQDYFASLDVSGKPFILLLTRGHQYDVSILREIIHLPVPYIGMIGSRRRISGVFSQLREELPNARFQHIYAPVGLDIGAQTPEEIAISVLAELLQVKNRTSGQSLKEKIGHFIVDRQEGAG